ncbi:cellulose synthase-like protein [Musa troglodytarum]|uniref:Cellulose synthase-like protein n=1 Tax=Musa troglodytarum TaxID=320322 RepID=A0A9E7HEY1_9LILI|nr:cellulose synthase-like protein [Musa troglodytarum]
MGGGVGDGEVLFETKRAKGRIWYKLYFCSVLAGLCMIWVYRAIQIPGGGGGGRWWAWIGIFGAELWFSLYWILTQAVRWNPTYRYTFKERLSQRYQDKLPNVDIFVCTADPVIEPPIMVINTVLSVMAYQYPVEKLSVYLSDDSGSELTFYALLEASRFAKAWLPFCKKFKVEPRSPAAYFEETLASPRERAEAVDWLATKSLYEEMENRIDVAAKLGRVPADQHKQHKGFSQWNSAITPRDHQAIVEILIDGRDEKPLDDEEFVLPTLVYMAREKRPFHHHNFKAGAMNSLLRVSSEISNGAIILNVDCDMYSNNSETERCTINITKNDIYGNSLRLMTEVDFHGLDGVGGPLYTGSGCFHRRECLMGKEYDANSKAQLELIRKNLEANTSILEEKAKHLITCSYESNTEWGKEMGLKYGSPVEDVITGLSIQCRGWKSIYFNPSRIGFLGVAPVTLAQTLVQHKRWSEGDLQIFFSKYCPFIFGHGKIKLGLKMAYTMYCLWSPCSLPTLYHVVILPMALRHGISLYPNINSIWFMPFAYVIAATKLYSLSESLWAGYTLKGWWNEQRMWLFKRLASYPFAVVDTFLKLLGVNKSAFVVTAKVADKEVSKRYEQEIMEFGSHSLMFTILATIAMLNVICLVSGVKRMVWEGEFGSLDSLLVQLVVCGTVVLVNIPVYEAMFLRSGGGRIPNSITFTSIALAILAYAVPMRQTGSASLVFPWHQTEKTHKALLE